MTIGANSIKIGKHTVTFELPAPKAPSAVETPEANSVEPQPESGESVASGEVVEPSEGSVAPVIAQTSTPFKAESKSTHSNILDAVAPSLSPAASKPAPLQSAVADVVKSVKDLSATVTKPNAAPTAEAFQVNTASSTLAAPAAAAATALVAPTTQVAAPVTGAVGFLNQVVTNLLKTFLTPAPNTPEPISPVALAVVGWVRRNLFNEAPTITYDPTTTTQTGQTVTGNIGAADPEGDPLTYTVTDATLVGPSTWATDHGTLTIDQATGDFTFTPDDINYDDVQPVSFTVSVSDGKLPNGKPLPPNAPATLVHGDTETINLAVQPPTVERVIVNLPEGYTNPNTPRFAADGQSLYFAVTPPGGARMEIHQINVDGTGLTCITCGASPNITSNLSRVVPYEDGSGRLMIQVAPAPGRTTNTYSVYEPGVNGAPGQLVPVIAPVSAARTLDPEREMRISPDGTHVLFSQVQVGQTGNLTAVPVVGRIVRTTNATTGAPEYHIEDARVVYPVGEGKQFTPDGKGVIIIGGQYEVGNVDDIVVDLETGAVTRLTANLDYEEDIDMSPNGQWIAVGSTRTYDALTPMSRIERPGGFLPAQIQGAVYEAYAGSNATNVSNQEWAVAIEDELAGENGIRLFAEDDPTTPEDEGDNYNARSMASWNDDGTAVAFWEAQSGSSDPTPSRLVIANLQYTTSVGPVQGDLKTPDPDWAPKLSESVPGPAQLDPPGRYDNPNGGYAMITEETHQEQVQVSATKMLTVVHTVRTVEYFDYVNEDGMILNGTESTDSTSSPGPVPPQDLQFIGVYNTIHYVADVEVTGTHTGYLKGDVTIDKVRRSIIPTVAPQDPASKTGTADDPGSQIRSSLDGDLLVLLDPDRIADTRALA